ncbi:MAG: hypothetical protein WCI73_01175 [Phycisphaerae bacterium]
MSETATPPREGQPPVKTFQAGGCRAAIWENRIEQNGQTVILHSTKITRSYKDEKDGTWHEVSTFGLHDLPKLALVAQEAYRYLSLKPTANQVADDIPV